MDRQAENLWRKCSKLKQRSKKLEGKNKERISRRLARRLKELRQWS